MVCLLLTHLVRVSRGHRRFAPRGAGAWAELARLGMLPACKKRRSRRASCWLTLTSFTTPWALPRRMRRRRSARGWTCPQPQGVDQVYAPKALNPDWVPDLAGPSSILLGDRLVLPTHARFWHPSGMRASDTVFRWSFPMGPRNDHRLPAANPGGLDQAPERSGTTFRMPASTRINPSLMQPWSLGMSMQSRLARVRISIITIALCPRGEPS